MCLTMNDPAPSGGVSNAPAPYGSLTFALRGNAASGGEFTRHDSKAAPGGFDELPGLAGELVAGITIT